MKKLPSKYFYYTIFDHFTDDAELSKHLNKDVKPKNMKIKKIVFKGRGKFRGVE